MMMERVIPFFQLFNLYLMILTAHEYDFIRSLFIVRYLVRNIRHLTVCNAIVVIDPG